MKLKSIQIAGFKSFANKTNIDFQNGFTGIVGPNGSGKSNVIEAVRWALGEQSAKSLRGKKMKDVIFSGSKDQHPLNRAEVSLIFDNTSHFLESDYSEVKVTRKYYRSGESIYSINDHECLLRDIHNLFMDTGLGEGSLSIISQGNVDDILDDDVQKRRTIIETAAGVYHYKKQKNESEKKLEDTQLNLDRISDIIREIEKQMNPLKEQSEIASLYLSKNKYLNELKFNKFEFVLKNNSEEKSKIQNKLKEVQIEHGQLIKEIDNLNLNKEKLSQKINQLDIDKENLQSELLEKNKLLENLSSEKKLNEQRKKFDLQKQNDLQQQLDDLISNKNKLAGQLAKESDNQESLKKQLTNLENKLKTLKIEQLEKDVLFTEKEINKGRSKYVELMQKISDTRNDLRMNEKLSQQADSNSKLLFQELRQKKDQLNSINESINNIISKLKLLKENEVEASKKLEKYESLIKNDENRVETMRANWLDALRIFQEAKTERDGLASLLENHNNLYHGTRNLLKQKEHLSGIIGAVGDYLNVNNQYIKAIETALGAAIQQIIVENVSDARKAIAYLNKNKLGRVTLLPVNGITDRFVSDTILQKVRQIDGFIGIASDLVQIDDKYKQVKQHLLGGIIIADSLKSATQISNICNHRVKVVSLDGDVVNAGGSITGGKNQRQNDGLLTQKNNLINLKNQVQRMQEKLNSGEQNLKEIQFKLKDDQEKKRMVYQDSSEISSKLMLEKNNLSLQENEKNKIEREIKALNLKLGNRRDNEFEQPEDLKQQITKLQEQIDDNQSRNKSLTSNLELLKHDYNVELNSKNDLQQQIGIVKERLSNVNQICSNIKQQIDKNEINQTNSKNLIKKIKQKLAEISKVNHFDTHDIQIQINETENNFNQTKEILDTKRTELQQLDAKIGQEQNHLIENNEYLNQFKSQLTVVDHNLSRIKTKFDELNNSNQIYKKLDLNLNQLNNEIQNIQLQISELGPVNLGSIEAYQEIKERHEFMQHQMNDLLEAKNQLLTIMDKMDETVKVRFEQAYNKISASFSQVFRNIFGGGEAKLELSEPHHLLTTGIDILVKPPGKRYRNITLLSGGEKALTALALLFAIIEVKPVPFVILDEAESALDPANVDRFAKYIKNLKNETQFIVVTHRKETMIYADDLFGITMQDSGVSKLVSVDLINHKDRR
ncbi:chromosome segregation protein SMC [Fructilactobacillus sanfranciscensis]|uniref:chromosome segregation protein SMC n=1 Tax=Fructilactobacillus sanfranciscensis TaxID=1625 RepID=UPI0006F10EE1|nr:chromosome segregation protein SMC [Fructilactobacillus sanfranciscensis]KRM80978.1 hypothetical protein FD36_GL000465 [Fructilactobacillus sanfranciscensis DSM 20451]POH23033.1 chromosome segregation protein SMC [Fructilactobacillus sanfranciscensis DSM 20451]QFX93917.1 chromosome segregation protein SMC [Fructilactobacillus sanfranciscensis]RDX59454.1 chromosome segregation protein SMC [Fructilactobacillus sanfranciscensis]